MASGPDCLGRFARPRFFAARRLLSARLCRAIIRYLSRGAVGRNAAVRAGSRRRCGALGLPSIASSRTRGDRLTDRAFSGRRATGDMLAPVYVGNDGDSDQTRRAAITDGKYGC